MASGLSGLKAEQIDRLVYLAGGLAVAAIAAFAALNFVTDPLEDRRTELQRRLDDSMFQPRAEVGDGRAYVAWRGAVEARPALWQELVEPPPPPPPPPPKPEPCPDLQQMLQGVEATRQQIGSAVKLITPDNPRGEFFEVGDTVNGVTLEAVSRQRVTFTIPCPQQNKTVTYELPRE